MGREKKKAGSRELAAQKEMFGDEGAPRLDFTLLLSMPRNVAGGRPGSIAA